MDSFASLENNSRINCDDFFLPSTKFKRMKKETDSENKMK